MRFPRRLSSLLLALGLGMVHASGASGQCMIANPSFELTGSGGNVFGGWNQFGAIGMVTTASHGRRAARVSGPNNGTWDVSGYWQQMTALPGERWSVAVDVSHQSTRPLTGGSQAIVNVEWRNSGGVLISYESHVAADATTPLNTVRRFAFTSQPAPTGTVAARILVGVLQSPTEPVPDVVFDHVQFDRLTTPSLDAKQWLDFPGGRTIDFSGRSWRVKGPGWYGPGPNLFGDATNFVWVDTNGRLHLTIQRVGNNWYSTEVTLEEALGYGDYVFTTRGRLDTFDPRTVLGLFIWEYGACFDPANGWWNPYNEIDIEWSRWGNPSNANAQFVTQPFDYPGNIQRFGASFVTDEVTSHAIRWLPDRVEYRSWRGGPADEATSASIRTWTYTGPHIPRPEHPRVHLNMWQFEGSPATNQEVVFDQFTFVPACLAPPCGVLAVDPPPGAPKQLAAARPNPFVATTAIRYVVPSRGPVEVGVYDLSGRRVRTLVHEVAEAGAHEVVWNGADDAGDRVEAGVYFYRLRMAGSAETRRVILVK